MPQIITAVAISENFDRYYDIAVIDEVVIVHEKKKSVIMLSYEYFNKLKENINKDVDAPISDNASVSTKSNDDWLDRLNDEDLLLER